MTATTATAPPETKAPRPRRPGGSHPGRWILGGIGLLILAIVIFLAIFNWDWFRPPLARMISARLHRPVRIVGHLKVHLFSWTPSATVGGLQIGNPSWAPKRDMADVDSITVKTKLLPLFAGKVILPLVQIEKPDVVLLQAKDGRATWDFSNGQAPGKPAKLPAIQNLVIDDGKLDVTSIPKRLKFTGTINARERATATGGEGFRMTGQGTLNAKPFTMNVWGGPLLNVSPDRPYPFDADVRAGDTHVTAKGQVAHPFNLGQVSAAVSLSGHDLADLYYLTGLALPNTPPYSISGQLRRDDLVYYFDRFSGRVGGSDLEGNLKADTSDKGRPDVTGDLRSRVLDFKDLGALFGASGANKPAAPHLATTPATTARHLLPDAPLDADRIRGMDADITYKALTVRAAPNLPLRQVSLGVKLDHGLLTLDPIDFAFPQGRLSGTAEINARSKLQKDAIDLRLSGVALQNFMPKPKTGGAPPPLEGVLDARAKMQGVGDTVHKAAASSNGEVTFVIPHGVIRQAFAELLGIDAAKGLFLLLSKNQHQTDVRCAVADFRVHDGVLQAQQVVIDTGVVQVNGSGDINLNDESLNLAFKGKPKQFRLIRLNAPITVGGHLSNPAFGIKPGGAITQAGVAVALAAAVNPLLAILPFVSAGLAHDADCAGLVAQAHSQGAPVKPSQTAHR